ncbi:MAG: Uma2 family endonuclease [Spirulinaceae cyanobacterium]
MVAVSNYHRMSPQDYLEWEAQQPLKYEYFKGEVVAMTGGTIPHNDLAVNLTTLLKNYLRGKGCKVQMADAKVEIAEARAYHYPDVMVTCDERDQRARMVIRHPCLIVEVLSPGTEAVDRGKKFQNYRQLATLKEYALVSAEEMMIEVFRRNEAGVWELYVYKEGDEVTWESVGWRCPIELIYEEVILGGFEA